MILCPNKNSDEWKALASKVGNIGAYQAWIANNYEIPPADKVVQSNLEEIKGRKRPHDVVKIISNGTDGVGRIALSVARELKFGTGGRALHGGVVEGTNMDEHHNNNIPETVAQNVQDSDGTIIFGKPESTAVKVAQRAAEEAGKPYIINPSADQIKEFVTNEGDAAAGAPISVLNVAGDRDARMTQNDAFRYSSRLKEALEIPIAIDDTLETKPDLEVLAITDKKTATQEDLVARLKDIDSRIAKANDGSGKYSLDGEVFQNRVTEVAQKLTDDKFGEKVYTGESNPVYADTGTYAHDTLERMINQLAGGEVFKPVLNKDGKPVFTDAQLTVLAKGAKKIFNQIQKTQKRIDPNGKAELMTEVTIADKNKNIAGTVDLLVTYSDGSVAIFDWKTVAKRSKDKVFMGARKEFQYGSQITEYKRILREQYGVNAFRQSRLVPIGVEYLKEVTIEDGVEKVGKENRPGRLYMLEDTLEGLKEIPVANEMTNRKYMDEALTALLSIQKSLSNERSGKNNVQTIERLNKRLAIVKESINDVQLKHNLVSALKEVSEYASDTLEHISINDENDPNYVDDLKMTRLSISAYQAVLKNTLLQIDYTKDKELKKKYQEAYEEAAFGLDKLDVILLDKAKERLTFDSANLGIEGVLDAQKEVGLMSKWFKHLNDWDNPAIDLLNNYVQKIQDNTRNRTRELSEEIQAELDIFQKAKGKSIASYDSMINKETGRLAAKFSSDFYAKRKELVAKGNVKELKKMYEYTAADKERYEQRFKSQQELYTQLYKSPVQRNKMMKAWVERNNLAKDSAWKNVNNLQYNATLKNPEEHYSSQYKAIQADPATKRFYNFYTSKMKELMELLPSNKRQLSTFIPNIQKDTLDALIQTNGRSLKTMGKAFIDSMEVRADDNTFGMVDELSGKSKRVIPILYMQPLRDSDGKVDNSRKSFDLGRNLLLFASSAYNYKFASETEAKVNTLKEVVASQKSLVVDQSGNVIKDGLGKAVKALGDTSVADVIEKYADYYLYGHKLQGIDKKITYKGKTYSSNKAIAKAISHYSLKTLGMNPISAVANLGGATANAFMTGKKGKYYSNDQLRSVIGSFAKPNNKEKVFAGYFDPFTDDMDFRRANDLSANTLSKWLTVDNLMIMQRKTDEFVDKSVAAAMGKNYGIDPETNRVVRLSRLPKGTKSLMDLATLVDGKIKIEGLTEDGYNQFRSMVKHVAGNIKGNTSKESINLIQTNVLGKLLMQFRSWLPQLAAERFRDPKYNNNMDEIELGRFRVAAGEIFTKGWKPAAAEFAKEFLLGGFGKREYGISQDTADQQFTKFITSNPAVVKKYKYNLETLKSVYMEERAGQMRALAAELRMYATVLAAIFALGSDWDDDDEPDYKNYWFTRMVYSHLDRLSMELGFFVSPSEGIQVMNKPVAIMSYVQEIGNLFENSIDETTDFVMGEDDTGDKTHAFYYTLKQGYGINAISKYMRDTIKAFDE